MDEDESSFQWVQHAGGGLVGAANTVVATVAVSIK